MILGYYIARIMKKMQGKAIRDTIITKTSTIEAGSVVVNSSFGRYSYCGYDCKIINCEIGSFVSIADKVIIGVPNHPLSWVSTSPAFYKGRDSIPKNLACLDFNTSSRKTIIGNDVWIGEGVYIKGGVVVGDGAVIGMGSVVTKDISPFSVYAGNPARFIRMRFDEDTICKLEESKWWQYQDEVLKQLAPTFDNVELFLSLLSKINNQQRNS